MTLRSPSASSISRSYCCSPRLPASRAPWRAPSARRAPSRARWPTSAAPRWRWAGASRCLRSREPAARVRAGVRGIRADGRRYRLEPARAGGGATSHRRRAGDGRHRRRRTRPRGTRAHRQPAGGRASRDRAGRGRPPSGPAGTGVATPDCRGRWFLGDPAADADRGARGRRPPALPAALLARARTCAAW